ncbi:MAG TPA: sulfotransferase, partial [Acidimicrobiales bacterium]|nr:sulfotransferase [Acidimicrobiales bacterium]
MSGAGERPLFIVGCGRSGTTLLYDILCCPPELGWFSRYTNRWPALPQLAALNRLYPAARRRGVTARAVPFPSEGHAVWDRIRPASLRTHNRPLAEADVAPGEAERAATVIATHLRFHGRPRFVNKNTRNTVRIPYLKAMFPDCCFVHLIRDPAPAVASFLKIDWWPDLKVWCFDDRTPRQWEAEGNRPETMAARLWREEVGLALTTGAALPDSDYLEVRYETLVAEPRRTVERVVEFAGLPWSAEFEALFATFRVTDRNRASTGLAPD